MNGTDGALGRRRGVGVVARAAARPMIGLIRLYRRFLSPLLGPRCRFEPSCSRYALAVLESHGVWRGSWLAVRRIGRCHPFHPGGYDPPPPARCACGSSSAHDALREPPGGGQDPVRGVGSTAGPDGDPVRM